MEKKTLFDKRMYLKRGENWRLSFDIDEVKEAILGFKDFRAYEIPAGDYCDRCQGNYLTLMKRSKYKEGDYKYCRECLILHIFGDFNK